MQITAATMTPLSRPAARPGHRVHPTPPAARATCHGKLLTWAFTAFNSVRIVVYLPTLWTIGASGHSDQHSLFTWAIFLGSNATLALWLYEEGGQRINRAVLVNCVNSVMCLAICLLIGWMRLGVATA